MAEKIDRVFLIQNLLEILETERPVVPEDLRYLMDTIVTPLLNDQTVPLDSLDYDQFSEADLDALEQYIERAAGKDKRFSLLKSDLAGLSPLCVPQPVFC